ncbi:sugar fermentation stimulation protein [Candidatus Mycoplasma haematobovis]|uniref:Sugar fermentation stimulation protein n=1 Tax=Candidatus Mycoplasma haematobovis TaxID=432608 RepID=A0A1A9QE32_9MOLU|nr:DNA/RNA nuclease SfsA [Candidatus Mycoplasma haematobovis]OAL09969.1 sugar fermentation stimulation protein [Candidatus Mycoplasma haematobovis]
MSSDYIFAEPLIEGVISERTNRFRINVFINNEVHLCHCPSTGKIGNFDLKNRPCLLSKSNNPKRKTAYTVEAVSLNKVEDKYKTWIGINQNAVNRYVEHYLLNGGFENMVGKEQSILREQLLGNSKIDFLVGDSTYVEVKMPLRRLQIEVPEYIDIKEYAPLTSHERLMKHLNSFGSALLPHQRAILLVCFIYDNPGFVVNKKTHRYKTIKRMIDKSRLEQWQANFKITPKGVKLTNYFPLLRIEED